jgi:hypothetical protein
MSTVGSGGAPGPEIRRFVVPALEKPIEHVKLRVRRSGKRESNRERNGQQQKAAGK